MYEEGRDGNQEGAWGDRDGERGKELGMGRQGVGGEIGRRQRLVG